MPGLAARRALTSALGSINGARLVLTRSAEGFMRARSSALTMPRVASTRRMCSESTSHRSKKSALLAAVWYPSARALAVAGDDSADPPIAIDAERLAAQRMADTDLPFAGFQRRHLLRNGAHRRQDQAPGEFGGCIRRRIGVLAR